MSLLGTGWSGLFKYYFIHYVSLLNKKSSAIHLRLYCVLENPIKLLLFIYSNSGLHYYGVPNVLYTSYSEHSSLLQYLIVYQSYSMSFTPRNFRSINLKIEFRLYYGFIMTIIFIITITKKYIIKFKWYKIK